MHEDSIPMLNHVRMKQENHPFREALLAYVFAPDRLLRISASIGMDLRTYLQHL